ncbi:uncharacterized protein LOC62_04G006274 [Vanrija pseudolonga]|uniref:Uncharacterized protein n=1 Tax=Vanrija pseudolonga TaxID=143232 RepID=A0AAF0YE14_9TREE|nr:hypothetical protein LOC62_04G006274 [Vanrija pseudolonga]
MLAKTISTIFILATLALAVPESSDGIDARDPAPFVPANGPVPAGRQSKNRRLSWDEFCALWQNQNCGHSCIFYSSLCCDQGSGAHCDA